MNEQQFLERAHANPHDDSPEFLDALADNAQRQQLVEHLKGFDRQLHASMSSVTAPAGLKQKLLAIADNDVPVDSPVEVAANDSFWRRQAKIAASLVVALGILGVYLQGEANPMEDMVFTHIYSEMSFLDESNTISLDDVNAVMGSWIGSEFANSPEMETLQITYSKDCWVDFANGVQGIHIVMQGNVGPVTVMVIPNTPLDEDLPISDERFAGLISPTAGGNLVVVGEKEESIAQYSAMLAANINW